MVEESRRKVLMLDDEAFLLEMYKLAFENRGYDVATYYKADDALNLLRTGQYEPDVILFDITMPDSRSGYEFVEAVTKEHLAQHALKVALTNEGREGAKERLAELGMDAYLQKAQYIPSEIVSAVDEMLAKRG